MRDHRGEITWVLGGAGFLGAHVVAAAHAFGGRVLNVCRHPESLPESLHLHTTEPYPLDLLDGGALEALLVDVPPDRVINCAALSGGGDCEARPALARALNSELPGRLAEACAKSGARLVHVSTDLVFGGRPTPRGGFREQDSPAPISGYGASKFAGEEAVLGADRRAAVVRLPLLFGNSGGRGLGASDALLAALARGDSPRLFIDEFRTPLDVSEAARALVELAGGSFSGLLHVAGPDSLSRFELGGLVLRAAGHGGDEIASLVLPARQAELNLDPPRPADVCLATERARSLLSSPLSSPAEVLGPPRR